MNQVLLIVAIVLLIVTAVVILAPRFFPGLNTRMTKMAAETYQRRMFKKIQKNYPLLAERLDGYEMSPESQETFQNAMKRLPPQEGMALQLEFNRLRDNFLAKHPEVQPLFASGNDGQAQAKAFDQLMKLPPEQRAKLEKDILWAWDHLRKSHPKQVGPLEAAFRKKPAVEAPKS